MIRPRITDLFRRWLNRITDPLIAEARAEHQQTGRPEILFRPRQGDVRDTAAAMIPPEED